MTVKKFIQRPVLSTVISVFLVLLGLVGLISLPIEQYPDIAPPTISVQTQYAGADAQTVLNSVIVPLEESINGVENMTYMTSSASNGGSASITVYFKQGTNADMAAVNVQNRVSQALALLPAEVTRVGVVTRKRQNSNAIVYSLVSEDGRYNESFLANYNAINLVPALSRINGVGDVQTPGMMTYSMRIWLKPEKMKQYGLMPFDITAALAEQNIEAAPGKFGEQSDMSFEYSMRYKGRLKTKEEFENILLQSNAGGTTLRLRDVADVELGGLNYAVSARNNGRPSIIGMVQQVAGSNANNIVKDIKKVFAEQEKKLPPGMKITTIMDVTEFLHASIHEIIFTLVLTMILVFIVVFVFLQDLRSTLIPLIAVPVSLLGTFFFLWIFGFSLNLLTLSALLLAIAIVVDDAIVVVEAVHAKLDQGYKSARQASIDAMDEITSALISITLVMAAVFVPVSFLSGTSGTFYREFGVTMAISIVISAVNALTLSPALCAIFLKPHENSDQEGRPNFIERFHTSFNASYEKLSVRYKKGVEKIIKHRVLTAITVVLGIVILGLSMQFTGKGLVPNEDTGVLLIAVSTPPGTSQKETKVVLEQVDRMLSTNPAIESRHYISGFSFLGGVGPEQGLFFVKLKPFKDRNFLEGSNMVLAMIYKQTSVIKNAQIIAFGNPVIPGFSFSSGLTLSMQDKTGGSLKNFFEVTNQFLDALNQRPEIANAMTSYNPNYPQYMVDVDVAKCKQAGISPAIVLSTLQGYYGGLYASNFNAYGKLYRVMIQGNKESRMRPEGLTNIYVRTQGGMTPISEFCSLRKVFGPAGINRFNLFTSIDLNVTPAEGYSSGDAIKAVEEVSSQVLPTGYGYEYSGLTRSEHESSNTTAIIFALCIVFVYLILSAQYESYLLPLAIILSIPFGLVGAFLFTIIFGHSNDIYMQIALIMLIGLLAKNAILIVQFALERRQTGMAIRYSAILGAGSRLRPILMTSMAMVIGLIPLMFAQGVGKNGSQTLGAAAVGGMLIGMILQVFVVPALFVIFQYLQEKLKPLEFEEEENKEVEAELRQYAQLPIDNNISQS